MSMMHFSRWTVRLAVFLLAAAALAGSGCEAISSSPDEPAAADAASAGPPPDAAQVWAENCGRCHNLRPPHEFDYDQWQVIVEHMRLRATLTADECRTILAFLKAAQ